MKTKSRGVEESRHGHYVVSTPKLLCLLPTAYCRSAHCRPADLPTCPLPTCLLPTCLLPQRAVQKRQRAGPGVLSGGFPVARLVVRVLESMTGAIVLLHVD